MVTMPVDQIGIYTVEDLERARDRDDRLRWELLDGELVMTPSPVLAHQRILIRLAAQLMAALQDSDGLELLVAPFDVHLSERTVMQPDLLVVRTAELDSEGLRGAPVLAVEVLSPSTRRRDLITKRDLLEQAGCPHYWVIDPDELTLRRWRLHEGRYGEAGYATAEESVEISEPVTLTLRVASLLPTP